MLIFQLLIYPRIVKRIGAKTSQRWACCIGVPVFLAYPFLSRLHDSERTLLAASLVLLFFTNVASNAVSDSLATIQCISTPHMLLTLNDVDVHHLGVSERVHEFDAAV